MFTLLHTTPLGRRGRMTTPHGVIESPFFMPVGTAGAMKGLTHQDLLALGAQILLCNTYHLHLQPGDEIVAEAGGLHSFIGWNGPILTDSGGFQVFSLRRISKITDAGVNFQSHLNGQPLFIGPEESMCIQHRLGADIIMCFDQCPPSTAARAEQVEAVDRTLKWAAECKRIHASLIDNAKTTLVGTCDSHIPTKGRFDRHPLLFGIVQGGLERDLREKCAQELIAIGFDGYAVGGLAVGETQEEMFSVLEAVCPVLPVDKPRYLMGVGRIDQMREAIRLGIDMFDCVSPMREARHGTLYLSDGARIRIDGAPYAHDHSPIDPHSPSPLSRIHKKSYLRHLLKANERLGETIACMQNLGVTLDMMKKVQESMDAEIN